MNRSQHRFTMRWLWLVLSLSITHQAATTIVYAQAGQAEATGTVTDEAGAGVAGAIVRVTQVGTNESNETTTGDDGVYTATNLRPGSCTLTVEARNFRRFRREGITLTTGERIRLDITLSIGNVEEVVAVRADASLLRTETGSLGQVIPNRRIVDLPLNGRNFFSLIALVPGVAAPPPATSGIPSFPRINGGRPRVNEYLYDGISALQPEPGQVAFNPIVDAIQEFKVEINSPPAEFGRFNGGVVNLTTKSGTNDVRGSVFYFLRNEVLNARNLFTPATTAAPDKPVFRRNQYGFVVGGPVVRDRTFFFGDFQGTRQLIGRSVISNVPTLAQRSGNFASSLGAPLFLQTTTTGGVTTASATTINTGTPISVVDTAGNTAQARVGQIFRRSDRRVYAGNIIPLADFDPVARQLLERYPLPTANGAANNFRRVGNEGLDQDQFDVRLDHRFSEQDQIFGRYSFFTQTFTPVTPLPEGSGLITTGTLGLEDSGAHQVVGNYIRIFSPTVINELRFGYTRRSIDRTAPQIDAAGQGTAIPGIGNTAAFQNTLPTFTIAGLQQLGPSANANSQFNTDVIQLYDAVGVQLGRHSTKFGVDFRLERLNVLQPPQPTGLFNFTAPFTNSRGTANTVGAQPGGATTGSLLSGQSGNALASFLLGQVGNFSIDVQQDVIRPRASILELFAQDDFKATDRLTLNLGLRYTLNFPSTETQDQGAIFNLQTQRLDYLGQNGYPDTARQLHKLNFGPRAGAAYRLTDRTVLRAGYGLIWQEQAGITTPFTIPQFPFIQTVTQRSLDGINPAFVLADGANVEPIPLDANAALGLGAFAVDRDLGSGYVQQWNGAVQREISSNLVAEVAYAGSKITHVGIPDTNINQLTADQLALGQALLQQVPNPFFNQIPRYSSLGDPTIPRAQLLRPFPRFNTVSLYRNNVGNTSYHALQAKLEQRFSRGLAFLVSYTRSKLIDDAGQVFDATILTGPVGNFPVADSFNRALEKDVSTGDIPNVFVTSFTYELPIGRNRFFELDSIADKLLGGWNITGLVQLQSGLPFPITQVTNFNAFAGFGTQRPNRVSDPNLPNDERTTARYFDTSAFTVAPQFTIGNTSRNPVRGPGYRTADIAFIKRTYLDEVRNIEFRTEIFNLTNTPPLGQPNGVLGNAAFGTITGAGDPRVIQFGLKLNF